MGTNNYKQFKKYGPFKGINKGVSDFNLPEGFLSLAKNAYPFPGSTALSSRPGFRTLGLDYNNDNRYFLGLFIDTDIDTGAQLEKEVLLNSTNQTIEVFNKQEIAITNSGATNVYLEINFNETNSVWRFQILNADTEAVIEEFDLGTSIASPNVDLITFLANINAYADFTAVNLTGQGANQNVSNVFIAQRIFLPTSATRNLMGYYVLEIPDTASIGDFINYNTIRAASYTNINGVMLTALPDVGLVKFDGKSLSKAGTPAMETTFSGLFLTDSTVGSMITGQYIYAMAYERRDAKGNVLEGLGNTARSTTSGIIAQSNYNAKLGPGAVNIPAFNSPANITVAFPGLTAPGLYDLRGAKINGNQTLNTSTLTITVDSGHTIREGDTICFRAEVNPVSSTNSIFLFTAPVTSVTSTTIIVDSENWGATNVDPTNTPYDIKTNSYITPAFQEQLSISVQEIITWVDPTKGIDLIDNDIISNNFRVNLYRSKGEGATIIEGEYPEFYLLDILPADFSSSTGYKDVKRDSALQVPWEQKVDIGSVSFKEDYNLSPKCSIVHNHQNRIYVAGDIENVNTLYRSDVLYGPEYFDPLSSLTLETKTASNITAIGSTSDNLVVGKSRGIKLISGDLNSDTNIRVDDISFELGLVNQATTVSSVDKCYGLTQLGPIDISSSGAWTFIGSRELGGKSRLEGILKNSALELNYASAVVNPEKGYYFLYLPNKQTTGLTVELNTGFRQFEQLPGLVYNVTYGYSYVYSITEDAWYQWDKFDATGGAYVKNGLLNAVRTGTQGTVILQESASGTLSDYVDMYQAINFDIATDWVDGGEPYMFKQFVRALLQNVETDPLSVNDFTVEIIAEKDWVHDVSQSAITVSGLSTVGYQQLKIKGNKSRSMRIRVKHSTIKKRPIITGITIELSAPFKPKIKQG